MMIKQIVPIFEILIFENFQFHLNQIFNNIAATFTVCNEEVDLEKFRDCSLLLIAAPCNVTDETYALFYLLNYILCFVKHMEMYKLSQLNPMLAGYLQRFHTRVFRAIMVNNQSLNFLLPNSQSPYLLHEISQFAALGSQGALL